MTWIAIRNGERRSQRFRTLKRAMKWSSLETSGFLCHFWNEVLDNQEDGDLSTWDSEGLAEVTEVPARLHSRLWSALLGSGYIGQGSNGRVVASDWISIAGQFLRGRYASGAKGKQDIPMLRKIWAIHGKSYGKAETGAGSKEVEDGLEDGKSDGKEAGKEAGYSVGSQEGTVDGSPIAHNIQHPQYQQNTTYQTEPTHHEKAGEAVSLVLDSVEKSLLPETWEPSRETDIWLNRNDVVVYPLDIEAFQDYCKHSAQESADWDAYFRVWMLTRRGKNRG